MSHWLLVLCYLAASLVVFNSCTELTSELIERASLLEWCTAEAYINSGDINTQQYKLWHSKCDWITQELLLKHAEFRHSSTSKNYLPSEIHLQYPNSPDKMEVIWATLDPYPANIADVQYQQGAQNCNFNSGSVSLSSDTDSTRPCPLVGHLPLNCTLYTVSMNNLKPNTMYSYRVGNLQLNQWSNCSSFQSAPEPGLNTTINDSLSFVLYGDMGIIPFGFDVTKMVVAEYSANPFTMLFHVGDLSYAGVSSVKNGELEFLWDLWVQQISAIATKVPYQVVLGNHEQYYNFTGFLARFHMPQSSISPSRYWYSYQYGPVYIIAMSCEHSWLPGSVQYEWIKNELKYAQSEKGISLEWIIFAGHFPFYSADADEYGSHSPGSSLLVSLEPLFIEYSVDIVFAGHMHVYNRCGPVYNATQLQPNNPAQPTTYINSPWPLYMTQGNAGALANKNDDPISPLPEWSQYYTKKPGFGKITITSNGTESKLVYEFKSNFMNNPPSGNVNTVQDSVTLIHRR